MPVFRDKSGRWSIRFRRVGASSSTDRRTVRISAKDTAGLSEARARKYCERLCADCEGIVAAIDSHLAAARTPPAALLTHALDLGAISEDEDTALRRDAAATRRAPRQRLTILDAAHAHESVQYERASAPAEYRRHLAALHRFLEVSGLTYIEDLRRQHALDWIAHLRRLGRAKATRTHAMLYLRYAADTAAVDAGVPNRLGRRRLDRDDAQHVVEVWPIELVCSIIARLNSSEPLILPPRPYDKRYKSPQPAPRDPRAVAAVTLGGLCGLRPSEIQRIRVGDIQDNVLHVGATSAKNRWSDRWLPLPDVALRAVEPLMDAPARAALLRPGRAAHFGQTAYNHWLHPRMSVAGGDIAIPYDVLRKSFVTWARRGYALDQTRVDHVEAWVGHRSRTSSAVTGRSYLRPLVAADLIPLASWINQESTRWLHILSTPPQPATAEAHKSNHIR